MPTPLPSGRNRPNVLFIVADDHQYDALGVAGHPVVKTPVLDRLALKGVRFTQATNMGGLMPAVCSPSRASLLTGVNPLRADADPRPRDGAADIVSLASDRSTLPQLFREAGYVTHCEGKWHNDRAALLRSFDQGSNIFLGGMSNHHRVPVNSMEEIAREEPTRIATGFSTEVFCRAAAEFISHHDQTQPFFCWLALTSPHDPRTPPVSFRHGYDPSDLPLPPGFAPAPRFDNGELLVRDEMLIEKPISSVALRHELAEYYGMISHQDREIGRVLKAIEASGAGEKTIIVYVGDHGLALGRHGLLGKQNLYEHSTRVPLIIVGPGVGAGVESDALVYSWDLFATLLDLAGLPVPDGTEAVSMRSLWSDPDGAGRTELFTFYKDCQRALRDERWKLIIYGVPGARRMELFDLWADPAEQHDLAGQPDCGELIERMQQDLIRWQRQLGDRWMSIEPTLPLLPDGNSPA